MADPQPPTVLQGWARSLRVRVTLGLCLLAAVLAAAYLYVLSPSIDETLLALEKEKVQLGAATVAEGLQLQVESAIEELESIATLPSVQSLERGRVGATLAVFDVASPHFLYFWVMDATGTIVSRPSLPARVGADRSTFPYFLQSTLAEPTHVQDISISPAGRFSLVLGTVIRGEGGQKVGVLAGALGLMDRNPRLYRSVLQPPLPPGWKTFLLSRDGLLIAHSDQTLPQPSAENLALLADRPAAVAARRVRGAVETATLEGGDWLIAGAPVPAVGWTVVVQAPKESIQAKVDASSSRLAWVAVALLVAISGVVFLGAESLLRPLILLTGALSRFGKAGEVETVPVPEGGYGEVSAALGAFNQMAAERKQAEEALRRSQEHLSITLNSISEAVVAVDTQGLVTGINPVAEDLTGWEEAAALGQPVGTVFRIVSEDTGEAAESPVDQVLREGRVVGLGRGRLLVGGDGTTRRITDTAAPMRDRQGRLVGVVLVFRDITEEQRLQEQVLHSQKMDSIGQLAGGVAHDFNNVLSGIMGAAELLLQQVPSTDAASRSYLEMILGSTERAAELTQKLLAFSRKGKLLSRGVDLNHVVREVVALLEHTIDPRIEIHQNLAPGPMPILGDPAQLQNALLNLAVNARDAMPAGGSLTLSTSITVLDEEYCRRQGDDLSAGEYVEVGVADTGAGIAPALQARIFEPFFTTKDPGKGTGLGLAAVYGTVKEHRGSIHVYSEPDRGTLFKLYLPVNRGAALAALEREEQRPVRGSGRVLVVDDEEVIRATAAGILQGLGYEVFTAADGEECVALYRSLNGTVDLVVLDLVMPRISGHEAFLQLRTIDPEAHVLIASGFSLAGEAQSLLAQGAVGFLQKPYRAAMLSRAVAQGCRKSSV
ncbi:MAG: response regulator [Deferrisomatales bacterium]|nr:response regulator [Deferrisomatales bacterium]